MAKRIPMKKPQRGGAREGAGRPSTTGRTESFTVRISPEGVENIKSKAKSKKTSASKLVDDWAKKLKTKRA